MLAHSSRGRTSAAPSTYIPTSPAVVSKGTVLAAVAATALMLFDGAVARAQDAEQELPAATTQSESGAAVQSGETSNQTDVTNPNAHLPTVTVDTSDEHEAKAENPHVAEADSAAEE